MILQWVLLIPIFDVCARDKGYKGGGVPEESMVATGGDGNNSQRNLGGDLTGGADKVLK